MFVQYDKVVYPGHGVAFVNRIITKRMGSTISSFYELKFLSQEMTILVPTCNAHTIGIRHVIKADALPIIFNLLAKEPRTIESTELAATNWSRRHKEYQTKLMTGKLEDISTIYREIKHIELQKDLSYGERTLLARAEALLTEELAIAQQTSHSKALEHIRSVFRNTFAAPYKQSQLE